MSMQFGDYLKKLRADRKMTLRDVENVARISNGYLSQLERGERPIPNHKVLIRLARAYGVPVNDLIEAAVKESDSVDKKSGVRAPDLAFMSRGYEKLSDEGKKQLKEYLRFLVEREKK